LKTHGTNFKIGFWQRICDEVLFPIFGVLRNKKDISRFPSQEAMSVWLSTTLISALRSLIELFTVYFETLSTFLGGLLDLLCACICQGEQVAWRRTRLDSDSIFPFLENDTLARIGTACFQQLLEDNVKKLSPEKWELIVGTFIQLFSTTTARQLFDESLRAESTLPEDGGEIAAQGELTSGKWLGLSFQLIQGPPYHHKVSLATFSDAPEKLGPLTASARRRIFQQIIVKCVLQLLLIETTHELLQNDDVYNTIPAKHLLRFMTALDDSYEFARKFNADKELRLALWKVGECFRPLTSTPR
jgi:brefeldin A-inhibited guanine nucleotide-exchange protein